MLTFVTSAKQAVISRTIGSALLAFRPNVPKHQFIELDTKFFPNPKKGEVVIFCGAKAIPELKKRELINKKAATLNSMREKPIKAAAGGHYMFTFDPSVVANEPEKGQLLSWDVNLAKRFLETGSLDPTLGDYKWVGSYNPLIERIKAKYEETGKPVDVAADIETMGFYAQYDDKDIIAIGFTDKSHYAECMYFGPLPDPVPDHDPVDEIWEQVNWLLTSPMVKLKGANFKFDLGWIVEKWGIYCTNFKFDTSLAGNLVDENRSNSLNVHCKTMTDLGGYDDDFNSEFDKGHMEEIPTDALLNYLGGDVDGTYRVAAVLKEQLLKEGMAPFYLKILHPAARAFERIEERGVVFDMAYHEELKAELETELHSLRTDCIKMLPRKMRITHGEKLESQLANQKNPLTAKILKEYFFTNGGLGLKPKMTTAKTGEPSTAQAHLAMFDDHPDAKEMCALLKMEGSAAKTYSTYVVGFMKHVRDDGKLHPSYRLFHGAYGDEKDDSGTTTGRLSCKDPAYQTIPKKTKWAKRLRKGYPAPPGKVVLSADFSQGELRVVACVAPEKTMLKAYHDGLDLHAITGAKLGGYSIEEFLSMKTTDADLYDSLRTRAKPANFGLLYGMGADGFRQYCWAQYGLKLTSIEAATIRDDFFSLYSGLPTYHTRMINTVHKNLEVISPLGRIRHLPQIKGWDSSVVALAERQAINSPIQSTLSDMMIWAIALIEDAYPNGDIEIVGMVHDALVAYVPEENVEYYAKLIKEVMENLPFHELGWKPELKFPVDVEVGPNLAQLTNLPLAA